MRKASPKLPSDSRSAYSSGTAKTVQGWIGRVTPLLNRLVNTLSAVLDPEAIVFGGQVPPPLARMLIARARYWGRHRYGIGMTRPELLLSEVAGDAAAAGAAMLPLREAFYE